MNSSPPLVSFRGHGAKAGLPSFRRDQSGGLASGRSARAFTLIELLVVMGIMVLLIAISSPLLSALKNSGDVTSAAYELNDALARARTSAMVNNTYVWVGFFEEDGSKASARPASAGVGRIILSTVFSKDGTSVYDPSAATPAPFSGLKVGQYGKLLQIEHAHLTSFSPGNGAGDGTFAGRPAPGFPNASDPDLDLISDLNPPDGKYTFSYPLGATGSAAQYTFKKMIQFSPRGEARINCTQPMQPIVEIGLMRSNGAVADTRSKNVVAIQMTGIASNLTIYRP